MILEIGRFSIELDEHFIHPGHQEKLSGHPDTWSPAEGPEIEYTGARIIRNGRAREVDPRRIVEALNRRYGDRWEEDAIIKLRRNYGTE